MTEKQKLLFAVYGLGIGGIEKCLINLINILPEDRFDVDIILMNPHYDLKEQIRRKVFFYDEFEYVLYCGGAMEQLKQRGGIMKNWKKLLPYVLLHFADQKGAECWKLFKPLPKVYDVAVCYSQNGYTPYYVIDKVKAKRKVLWYHNGAYEYDSQTRHRHRLYYPHFDWVVAVANECCTMLKEKMPYMADKILVLRNMCDNQQILEKSREFVPHSYVPGKKHIVTVGRMTPEKGALRAAEVCSLLRSHGKDICWHWVGDGEQSQEVLAQVRKLGLEDRFVLEGNQNNPYPYIACADIYVQASDYEAYSTTVTEAKVLCKPIVVTDVGGMREQLTDGETGRIVPLDAASVAEAVEELLDQPALCRQLSEKLRQETYENNGALQEYYRTVFA